MERPQWVSLLAWFWRTRLGQLALLTSILLSASAVALLPALVLNREFDRLEQAAIQQDAKRVEEGVQSELRVLAELCKDWAIWDDAYAFAADRNPAFVKANLGWDSLLSSTLVQLIYVVDRKGEIVWGDYHPRDATHSVSLQAFSQNRIHALPLLAASQEEPHAGLIMTQDGPLLLVSQPIKHSNNQGPVGGTILMGGSWTRAGWMTFPACSPSPSKPGTP
jgi:sensor domain CHASE-containing protein